MTNRPHLQMTHRHDDRVIITAPATASTGSVDLFEYVYKPVSSDFEGPKPYLHPVRTLAGDVVTTYRPHDHLWHKGIQMTIAHLSGENFWGGNTYVHGTGYVRLPEVGRMDHHSWNALGVAGQPGIGDALARIDHDVIWRNSHGEAWVSERRTIDVDGLDATAGWWSLRFRTALTNIRNAPLEFGSPTTHGRPMAGYGGLFWRGPRDFADKGGTVIGPDGASGEAMMGVAAPWLAYVGLHDGTEAASTMIFINQPDSFRYPTKWFVRTTYTPVASFAPVFDQEHVLLPGETFTLHHRIVVAAGALSREQIEAIASS